MQPETENTVPASPLRMVFFNERGLSAAEALLASENPTADSRRETAAIGWSITGARAMQVSRALVRIAFVLARMRSRCTFLVAIGIVGSRPGGVSLLL